MRVTLSYRESALPRASRESAWLHARMRLHDLAPAHCTMFAALLDHVERARPAVEELGKAVEAYGEAQFAAPGVDRVLTFVRDDVIDAFRCVELSVADLVPGLPDWREAADPWEADGDASMFDRYLQMLAHAAADQALPRDLRQVATRAGNDLGDWYAGFERRLRPLADTILSPLLSADAVPDAPETRYAQA